MGELQSGRYINDDVEAILDALMADAKAQFGDDLNDDQTAVIRTFYRPVAVRLSEVQQDIGLILDSAQLDYAEGEALDLLTSLIGVRREDADQSDGEAKVYLESADTVDHNVPKGTVVATNSEDAERFVTTESRTLVAGDTSVLCPIEAEEGGKDGNVGKNTITVFPDGKPFPGAEVTNPQQTSGGSDRELDDELRARAQDELADGARATGPALVSGVLGIKGVTDVSIFINDTDSSNGRGYNLPPHSFEMIATTDGTDETHKEISQRLMDTKAVGDVSVAGENGNLLDTSKDFVTADGEIYTDLPNGQEHPVGFSLSTKVNIYVDVDITTSDGYEGDDDVRDSIVDYIGGWTTNGAEEDGELATGDDVIHSQVQSAVMDIDGVHDINHVYIDTSSSPTSTSNISLADHEQAITDAQSSDQHITMTTN